MRNFKNKHKKFTLRKLNITSISMNWIMLNLLHHWKVVYNGLQFIM